MTPEQLSFIKGMEQAGKIAAETLDYIAPFVQVGKTTKELDDLLNDYIKSRGAVSACIGYYGWPAATCISVEEDVCHGVPSDRVLKANDSLNIDVTVISNGYYGDTSRMYFLGTPPEDYKTLLWVNEDAVSAGIDECVAGKTTGDIGYSMYKGVIQPNGFFTTPLVGGHGIGQEFHMKPYVPFFGSPGKGPVLKPWTCITIEPIVLSSSKDLKLVTVNPSTIETLVSEDKCLNSQLEHTILITDSKPVILTL